MNTFKEMLEAEFEDYKGDTSLKNAYYNATSGIHDLLDNLEDGNYTNIAKEFKKIVKAFDNFDRKVGFGKNL